MTAFTTHVALNANLSRGHGQLFALTHLIRMIIGTLMAITVFATLFLAFISMRTDASAAGPQLFGRHFLVVRSGSMAPVFASGSMVAIHQTNPAENVQLPVGTVVAFRSLANSEVLITHRIVDVVNVDGSLAYQTKGDANATVDGTYLDPARVLGTYSFSVPRLGFFMVALQGRQFLLTLTAAFTLASISLMLTNRASMLNTQKENQI
jgi:signal peptidase